MAIKHQFPHAMDPSVEYDLSTMSLEHANTVRTDFRNVTSLHRNCLSIDAVERTKPADDWMRTSSEIILFKFRL
jgi:hypothetical protein